MRRFNKKVLAAKPKNLNPILGKGTRMVEGENKFSQAILWPLQCALSREHIMEINQSINTRILVLSHIFYFTSLPFFASVTGEVTFKYRWLGNTSDLSYITLSQKLLLVNVYCLTCAMIWTRTINFLWKLWRNQLQSQHLMAERNGSICSPTYNIVFKILVCWYW